MLWVKDVYLCDRDAMMKKQPDLIPDARLGDAEPAQIEVWRKMTGAQRLEIAFQLYQMALEAVRANERMRHPDITEEELNWRVTRRMQGDPSLGRH
jgi:hypothetical protein